MESQLQIRCNSEIGLAIRLRLTRKVSENVLNLRKDYGRPVGTRTPDLYRVNDAPRLLAYVN
jgi:hypothetical protein